MTNKKPDIKPEDLSIMAWIFENQVVSEKGDLLDFTDRMFLLDILTDWNQEIVIKKCAQIGGSVTFNIKSLFAVIKFGWNILYTFPTDSDVSEFVSSKTNKILQANPQVFQGMNTDNIERKELNGRFMFFKGTVSKTAAIMTTADLLIHDEASRSDQSVIDTMKSRTKASKYKGRWLFSNPTTEKDAIDIAWQRSDKKEWMIKCHNPECKEEQFLTFPENINFETREFQCKECKTKLYKADRRMGRWVAQNPGKEVSGYHISLMMAPWVTAEEIIKDSEGDQEYFYNFVLGEPYSPGDIRVGRSTILDNWTPKNLETGKWFLGVDVGNIKHYVLGSEKGPTKIGRFSKWTDLDEIMKQYKPKLVIDAMPDNTMSKYYVENYRNALMSFFQENKNNPKTIVWWGENDREGVVYSNRNRILDQLIDEILNAKILFGLSSDSEIKNYLKHWETLRRVKIVDNKGIESYQWDSTTGEDHYVFATLYYYLATLGDFGVGKYMPEALRGTDSKILIGNDNVMGDLGEILAQNNDWQEQN
ncbi:MAG TPA: hypothetical protein DEO59_02540 [Balneola sp.]|jgi:hypothetical protein|nr:hypothetical protein [Balneola sp.]|tara:strand:- start:1346 stop:2944 length:1599 start_codon:yes stop_codon:yes gene_type:complete